MKQKIFIAVGLIIVAAVAAIIFARNTAEEPKVHTPVQGQIK